MSAGVKIDNLTPEQQAEIAKKFKQAPCIVCNAPMTGYRKIPVASGDIALLPVCDRCRDADQETLQLAMGMLNAQHQAMVQTR